MVKLKPALLLAAAASLLWGAAAMAAPRPRDTPLPVLTPTLSPARANAWRLVSGQWRFGEGILEQEMPERLAAAILTTPVFADFRLTAEVNIRGVGSGVRAAAILFRATGTLSYYWLHLDARNNQAILVRSAPDNPWIELARRPLPIRQDTWHTVQVECAGPRLTVHFDDAPVFSVTDSALVAGRVGFGTSQGRVAFRALRVEGRPVKGSKPLKNEHPPYQVISRGEAAGPYQAFPDVCRLKNGDLLCVFYAGYGHVSLPNAEWPKGGRICLVRSRDEGRTWSPPRILFDGEQDDRDPHIAQMSDGTLLCSFFSYWSEAGKIRFGTCLVASRDGGETWDTQSRMVLPNWACSAPVREMKDGTYLLGVYTEENGKAWGGVIRSTDRGQTWSAPIPIGKESGVSLDAETDVIPLKDGTLFAALRSSQVNQHYALSPDLGLTWSPVQDIGFKGHCPHLTRLRNGAILLTQRLPGTALYVSRDEAKSWQGPYALDSVIGAYPSTVELKDGSVLVVYYEEGEGSAIRALRFRLKKDGIEPLAFR